MNNYQQTTDYITALTGDPNTPLDWRMIHDKDKSQQAHTMRGTLDECWHELQNYNTLGWGIFCAINQLDGQGRELSNVSHIRAHVIDLDDPLTGQASYELAVAAGASFAVVSSTGKSHVYWQMIPYTGNDFYTLIQRKLAQFYNSDRNIIDATRVMRVPGFLHQKGELPHLVTYHNLSSLTHTSDGMHDSLAHVQVFEHMGTRSPLGTDVMQAPSLDWLKFALSLTDPNDMDRAEWLSMTAAIKQSGWNHTDDETLYGIWSEWCNRYTENDAGENRKLWNSINDTEVGWTSIERRSTVKAYMDFGFKDVNDIHVANIQQTTENVSISTAADVTAQQQQLPDMGEILSEYECAEHFKDCHFVSREGKIFTNGRFMNVTQFNGTYGGKQFIISSTGKLTDEPWKAALRSTCYVIPKIDHVRFLPDKPTGTIIMDALGRQGLNTYIPAIVDSVEGDISPWFDHMNRILPNPDDQRILFEYMAHNVKYPGFKIPWAPLLQSAEGIGKGVFFELMQHALGKVYTYSPKASELVKSGSVFNAWMRSKLMIMVNEIKIDERRELVEILKPMISDKEVEVQGKGVDQDMEDNCANWFFFSNFRDAVPISINGRRYSINYSALQSEADILNAGMDDAYFNRLWSWLREGGGYQAITYWLLNYPIEHGAIPMRAPKTSSHAEALLISRSPMEIVISERIADNVAGFKGGYISTEAVLQKCRGSGLRGVNTRVIQTCLENMGYVHLGRSVRPYIQENISSRTEVYGLLSNMTVEQYGPTQGYG